MLCSLDSGFDVIAITETRLNPNSISNTELLNYNLFHVDSPTLAAGVTIYANKALKTIPRPDLKIDLRGGHWGLRYCGIGSFFLRYFGNFNLELRYCGIFWTCGMRFFSILCGIKNYH